MSLQACFPFSILSQPFCCCFPSLSNETVSDNSSLLQAHISITLCLLHLLWIYIGKMSLIFLILLYLIQLTGSHSWFSSLLFQKGPIITSIPNSKGLYLHLIIEGQILKYVLKTALWKFLEVQKSNLPRSGLGFECFGPKACYMIWQPMFMCLQSFPDFILWTPTAFSGIFAQRLWPSENANAHIWVLLILHSLHKIGRIKAVFSAAVVLHLLRFGELCHLSMGFLAAQKRPFPVQNGGSTQPDVSSPKPSSASWPCHLLIVSVQPPDSGSTLPIGPKILLQEVQEMGLLRWTRHEPLVPAHPRPWGACVPPHNTSSPRPSWEQEASAKSQV